VRFRQFNDLVDRHIEIKAIVSWWRFLDLISDPVDDVSGSIGIAYDTAQGFPHFAQIWRLLVQKNSGPHGRCCVPWQSAA